MNFRVCVGVCVNKVRALFSERAPHLQFVECATPQEFLAAKDTIVSEGRVCVLCEGGIVYDIAVV